MRRVRHLQSGLSPWGISAGWKHSGNCGFEWLHGVRCMRPELPGEGHFRQPGRGVRFPDHQYLAQGQRDREELRRRVLFLKSLVIPGYINA